MRAAQDFASSLIDSERGSAVDHLSCVLYGSLGATGRGHRTHHAVVAGLSGADPTTCDPDTPEQIWNQIAREESLLLAGAQPITMKTQDIQFEPETRLSRHPNALSLTAFDSSGSVILAVTYYSIGGGFVIRDGMALTSTPHTTLPYEFENAAQLVAICEQNDLTIAAVAQANELAVIGNDALDSAVTSIWAAMSRSIDEGMRHEGILPGGLGVERRAAGMRERLETAMLSGPDDRTTEWLHTFAMAVNEENAAGRRIVTAPTNGAAGIVPAVARYYLQFVDGAEIDDIGTYLLTATAIGSLFKSNGSISGADAGCQGEVGSACAMAAGALCAVLGGTAHQIENAAEIAMEHHLGLTCDPVGGLVQIPCIERNGIAAVTAVSAAKMALNTNTASRVSLDTVIETMVQTGRDMSTKYKETSMGGLALNVPLC